MNRKWRIFVILCTCLCAHAAMAEALWLHDNTRVYGIISGIDSSSAVLKILLPDCGTKDVPLADIISIDFRGRSPSFLQSGTQEFIFQRGGALRGEIVAQSGETVVISTSASGAVNLDFRQMTGLLGLPVEGTVGRRAQQSLALSASPAGLNLDVLLDRRGSSYNGVLRRVDRTAVTLDHEDVLRPVPFPVNEIAGVRLAEADRAPAPPMPPGVYLRFHVRDGSCFDAVLQNIHLGIWRVRPLWQAEGSISLDISEVISIETIGGRIQHLSQISPVEAVEKSGIAPLQRLRINRNCQGGTLAIGYRTFPWGLGVHANSQLTYELNGQFKEFHSVAGLDSHLGEDGRVIFTVSGDGHQLFKSVEMKCSDVPLEISVPISGVKRLSLSVTAANGNDLGDAADWGSARVVR